jgi:NADH:ubiquinone reductase (H+-translocating)
VAQPDGRSPKRPRRWRRWRDRVVRVCPGLVAGALAGLPVAALLTYQWMTGSSVATGLPPVWALVLYAPLLGALVRLVLGPRPKGLARSASGGVLLGLLGWVVLSLTLDPLWHGHGPTWSLAAAAASYRALVGDLLHGGLTGLLLRLLPDMAVGRRWPGSPPSAPLGRVVIVGGGFAGVSAARRFERLARRGVAIDVTLISSSNFLLFTPMLAEVASGALEPAHISTPVRAAVAHTRFRNRTVVGVDHERSSVLLAAGADPVERVPYDHLVLAVGSVPQFLGLPGVAEHSFRLKDLDDATQLRNHVLELLERADSAEAEPAERTGLLTFVVAGGGFAGAEAVAELFDLVHGVLHFFPGVAPDEPRFVLVHSREHILPELSTELGSYALGRLRARGIEFRLSTRVAAATSVDVLLDDGARIPTRTFVWTAGNQPNPMVRQVAGEHARNGALVTDATFRVAGSDRIWAVGDCARIPDPDRAGATYPPTAQHAIRQGKVVADNVAAVLRGEAPGEFRFRTIGILVALGHRTAAAEIRDHRFSGFAAWLMWRGIYLAKLPGIEKQVRVLLDWLLELVFPRDIVVTERARPEPSPVHQERPL